MDLSHDAGGNGAVGVHRAGYKRQRSRTVDFEYFSYRLAVSGPREKGIVFVGMMDYFRTMPAAGSHLRFSACGSACRYPVSDRGGTLRPPSQLAGRRQDHRGGAGCAALT